MGWFDDIAWPLPLNLGGGTGIRNRTPLQVHEEWARAFATRDWLAGRITKEERARLIEESYARERAGSNSSESK